MVKYSRAQQATDDNIIRGMRFACWITKATDTHSEYVLLIAFARQQWLHKTRLNISFIGTLTGLFEKRREIKRNKEKASKGN